MLRTRYPALWISLEIYIAYDCTIIPVLVNPKESHAKEVKYIGQYLKGTKDKVLIIDPKEYSFGEWVDADKSGNWKFSESEDDPATTKYRTGYLITYAKCPIVWNSKLQGEMDLSTTEAEFISLRESTRDVIPIMGLIEEVQSQGFSAPTTKPTVHCNIFEDNSGALEIAKFPNMRSRTKHINLKYHHF